MANEYEVKVLRVVDGDTVDVDIDLGFGIILTDERVRISGIDAPESRTSDPIEKIFGLAAKDRLKELLGKKAILITYDDKNGEDMKGKFGRVLGDFKINDKTVADILIEEGHAVAYYGQNKADIEVAHLSNRNKLMQEGVVDPKLVQEVGDK
jgi:micrococcal nuclease